MTLYDFLSYAGYYLGIGAQVAGAAGAIAAVFPQASGANKTIATVRQVIDVLGCNVANAKNLPRP